jgi:hypothetical protein
MSPAVAIAVLGFAGSGFAYLLYYRLLSQVSATHVTAVTYLLPLWGLFWGLFGGESIGFLTCLGVAITIAGLILLNLPPRQIRTRAKDGRGIVDAHTLSGWLRLHGLRDGGTRSNSPINHIGVSQPTGAVIGIPVPEAPCKLFLKKTELYDSTHKSPRGPPRAAGHVHRRRASDVAALWQQYIHCRRR